MKKPFQIPLAYARGSLRARGSVVARRGALRLPAATVSERYERDELNYNYLTSQNVAQNVEGARDE
jgi:hypothetical protein